MAAALAIDVPTVPHSHSSSHPLDNPSPATMATVGDSYVKPSSSRHIPSPVTIPPRFDADGPDMHDSSPPAGSSLSPQASPCFVKHPPPLPIPDFVFPARSSNPGSNSAPSSYSRATGRRPKSVADLQDRGALSPMSAAFLNNADNGNGSGRPIRSPALPDFVFNPGGGPGGTASPAPSHAFLSPPQSPQSARAIPIRPGGGGHRRGGSEFVGGSLRSGEPFAFLSTSPTKSESGLASPRLSPLNSPSGPSAPGTVPGFGAGFGAGLAPNAHASKPSGPPGGRRGHAHRRSAAISIHDISSMMQPTKPSPTGSTIPSPSPGRGSSAPSSPKGFGYADKKEYVFPERSATDPDLQSYITPDISSGRIPDLRRTSVAAANAQNNDDVPAQDALSPEPATEDGANESSARPAQRTRVGFSDTLEFIPRPLSVVSSDSASTVTVRPPTSGNHSVSGSISSIISLNASIAASIDREAISPSPLARSSSRNTVNESRPSTAGAILDRTQSITMDDIADGMHSPRRRNSIPILSSFPAPETPTDSPPVPASAASLASPSKTPKRWSFFSLDPFIGGGNSSSHSSPTRPSCSSSPLSGSGAFPSPGMDCAKAISIGSPPSQSLEQFGTEAGSYEDVVDDSNGLSLTRTVSRKPSMTKKKKKVKSWGILSRKSKPRRKSRRAPTPPPIVIAPDSDNDSFEVAECQPQPQPQPTESTAGLEAGDFAAPPPPLVFVTPSGSPSEPCDSSSATWQPLPSPSFSVPDEDTSLAMIDLDAALGPFNTPLPLNHEWEAAQSAGGLSKRQLHSAAGMSRFSGPGMHYSHRRAESAPEMPPFNRAGIPRFSSSTAMADVFEEDEEDDDDGGDGNNSSSNSKTKSSTQATLVPATATVNASCSVSLKCTSKPSSLRSASSSSSVVPPRRSAEILQERSSNIDIRVTSSEGSGSGHFDFTSTGFSGHDDATSSVALSRRGSNLSGVSDDDKTQPSMCLKSEYSASSLHDDVIVEEEGRYMSNEGINNSFSFDKGFDKGFDNDSCEFTMESSSDSTIHSPGRLMKGKDLAPVDVSPLHLATTTTSASLAPVSPYSMAPTSASAFPSSPRSPMSYDANRISLATAPSSITDDNNLNNFQSLLLGEPGPEVRISSDIPSLTSSNSTMTRESAPHMSYPALQGPPFMPQTQMGAMGQMPPSQTHVPQMPQMGPQPRASLPSRGMERPASFTSTAFGRRRSSLASLHRLISTSHGERSKLSIEVPLDTASTASGDAEKHKSSRTKRLSRLMQFWRKEE